MTDYDTEPLMEVEVYFILDLLKQELTQTTDEEERAALQVRIAELEQLLPERA